jgi:hypothetical protein
MRSTYRSAVRGGESGAEGTADCFDRKPTPLALFDLATRVRSRQARRVIRNGDGPNGRHATLTCPSRRLGLNG